MRMFFGLVLAAAAAAPVTGCITITNAPEDLEIAVKSYWQDYEKASDGDVAEATRTVDAIVQPLRTSGQFPTTGRIGKLEQADLGEVGMKDKGDASSAQGIMIATEIGCTLDQIERILIAKNQTELYPEVYTSYDRTYAASADDYLARKATTFSWSTHYSATVASSSYDVTVLSGVRRIPDLGKEKTPFGSVLLSRTYWPAPAHVVNEGKSWKQDYQMEAYYETEPGKVIHLYGVWREIDMGYSMASDSIVKFMLNSMLEWDDRTTELCKANTPTVTQ